jgi:dTDP-4-amino-4,6-dideoxygalactose transaminase
MYFAPKNEPMIHVTKTYLPPFEEYTEVLKRAWDKAWITNNGELLLELEAKLKSYLGVKHLFFTNNGTVVLQMALKALNITGEVITTPFSYVATTNALLWEGCKPVFADIDPINFCIDPDQIEKKITPATQAILATHVYGLPCAIEKIQEIAERHNLKVIYDGAHAFGCNWQNKSLLSYGDISTCSFHATKLFHTVEGGCIITNNDTVAEKLMLYRQFGHVYDDYISVGINAKNSEFHAAMGLCMLPRIPDLISLRKEICNWYDQSLSETSIQRIQIPDGLQYNFAYYPIVFKSESDLASSRKALEEKQIFTRRYFHPSLNELPFIEKQNCPVSEAISRRVLCLPLSHEITQDIVHSIAQTLKQTLC